MSKPLIGVQANGGDSVQVLGTIRDLERRGLPAAWLTAGGAGPDALTLLAVAATQTERILLGTSIIPTWPRHPLVAAQQAQVVGQLAPGRFRLGVGPSHPGSMGPMYGVDYKAPVTNLREYVTIVKDLLRRGRVEFVGRHYTAHATLPAPMPGVPVMGSALRAASFEACGAVADGAISWICPAPYLRDVGLLALRKGAGGAGRSAPPLIAHIVACAHTDAAQVRDRVRANFGGYLQSPNYRGMFIAAGYPEAASGAWSDAMIDAVVAHGTDEAVADRIRQLLTDGAGEVLVTLITAGDQPAASRERTLSLLAALAAA